MAESRKWSFSKWLGRHRPERRPIWLTDLCKILQPKGYKFFQFGHLGSRTTKGPGETLVMPVRRGDFPNNLSTVELPESLKEHLSGLSRDTFFLFIVDPLDKSWLGWDLTESDRALGSVIYVPDEITSNRQVCLRPTFLAPNGKHGLDQKHYQGDIEFAIATSLGEEPILLRTPHPMVQIGNEILFEHEITDRIEWMLSHLTKRARSRVVVKLFLDSQQEFKDKLNAEMLRRERSLN